MPSAPVSSERSRKGSRNNCYRNNCNRILISATQRLRGLLSHLSAIANKMIIVFRRFRSGGRLRRSSHSSRVRSFQLEALVHEAQFYPSITSGSATLYCVTMIVCYPMPQ